MYEEILRIICKMTSSLYVYIGLPFSRGTRVFQWRPYVVDENGDVNPPCNFTFNRLLSRIFEQSSSRLLEDSLNYRKITILQREAKIYTHRCLLLHFLLPSIRSRRQFQASGEAISPILNRAVTKGASRPWPWGERRLGCPPRNETGAATRPVLISFCFPMRNKISLITACSTRGSGSRASVYLTYTLHP